MSITKFCVSTNGEHRGAKLLAAIPFTKGDIVDTFINAPAVLTPTYQTIQVNVQDHVFVPDTLAKLNHSCYPTTFVDTKRRLIIARQDIAVGEELTFFYPSTEWVMTEPFDCQCGSTECIGWIRGAKFLSPNLLPRYFINFHILQLTHK